MSPRHTAIARPIAMADPGIGDIFNRCARNRSSHAFK